MGIKMTPRQECLFCGISIGQKEGKLILVHKDCPKKFEKMLRDLAE